MKLCFATLGCPNWTLAQVVENGRKMGYDGVELRGVAGEHIGPEETPAARTQIKKMFADAGLRIASIMAYSNFTADEPEKRQADEQMLVKYLELARDVGCPTIRIFAGRYCTAGQAESVRRATASLRKVTPTAQKLGVRMAIETHDDWCRGHDIMTLLKEVNSPALGICWDLGNATYIEPLDQTYAQIKDHVFHVHYKDVRKGPDGHNLNVLPGTGEVQLEKAMRLLHGGGYTGWLSFEWEKKWQPQIEEPEVALPAYVKFTTNMMKKVGVPRG